jgi:hypothetical protein
VGDIIKAIFTVKSLGLGWAVWWRSMIAIIVNAIAVMIVLWLASFLGDVISGILSFIAGIYMIIFSFMAMGWAVQRIKDKL